MLKIMTRKTHLVNTRKHRNAVRVIKQKTEEVKDLSQQVAGLQAAIQIMQEEVQKREISIQQLRGAALSHRETVTALCEMFTSAEYGYASGDTVTHITNPEAVLVVNSYRLHEGRVLVSAHYIHANKEGVTKKIITAAAEEFKPIEMEFNYQDNDD